MSKKAEPRFSVTLYSYSKELFTGYYSIEDCLDKVKEAGAQGVEIVSSQHLPEYPNPSTKSMEEFRKNVEMRGLLPVCYGAYADTGIKKGKSVSIDELTECLLKDIKNAHIMGFPVIRLGYDTPIEVIYRTIGEAEKRDIRMGIEIHAPLTVAHPIYLTYKDAIDKMETPYLGFVPDFSGWAKKLPEAILNAFIAHGMPEQLVNTLASAFVMNVELAKLKETMHSKGVPASFDNILDLAYHLVVKGDPKSLKDMLKQSFHVHAKFWSLNDNDMETCIPYDKLLSIVMDSDYSGFITSEYEGYELTDQYDGQDNVLRHINMMRRLLKEA